jgi:hypothetical protein
MHGDIGDETLAMLSENENFRTIFLRHSRITSNGVVDFIEV